MFQSSNPPDSSSLRSRNPTVHKILSCYPPPPLFLSLQALALSLSLSLSWNYKAKPPLPPFLYSPPWTSSSKLYLSSPSSSLSPSSTYSAIKRSHHHHHHHHRLPPGSLGLPLIGHTPSFLRAQRRNRLFQDFLQPLFTKHGPIFKTRLMGHPTVIVSGPNANRFFLSSEFRHVVSSWPDSAVSLIGRRSIMEAHGARHKRLRVAVLASMCPPEALALRVSAAVHAHLDTHWRGRDSVKLFDSMKRLTFSVFCECFLGVKEDFGLFELFECVLGGVFAVPFGWRHWRAKRARAEIERRLVALVRERAACSDGGGDKEKDLMGRLMEVAEEGGEREIVVSPP
ncbi:hypothetical protein AMTR_s00032p00231950 [Amborella trichopoda]|uniref:Cytochrome P450 n=1 Tax=Amborella trichopoda TaxID=13333 RepID=U5CPD0_AMBTC|nr:hypothetical protein AMTR_s00032p00231950 [Amborella trichopoda]